ncbi:MAG: hypothetical protein O3A01_07425 [bacterium]|nr:hypothetical protein [bacterium]
MYKRIATQFRLKPYESAMESVLRGELPSELMAFLGSGIYKPGLMQQLAEKGFLIMPNLEVETDETVDCPITREPLLSYKNGALELVYSVAEIANEPRKVKISLSSKEGSQHLFFPAKSGLVNNDMANAPLVGFGRIQFQEGKPCANRFYLREGPKDQWGEGLKPFREVHAAKMIDLIGWADKSLNPAIIRRVIETKNAVPTDLKYEIQSLHLLPLSNLLTKTPFPNAKKIASLVKTIITGTDPDKVKAAIETMRTYLARPNKNMVIMTIANAILERLNPDALLDQFAVKLSVNFDGSLDFEINPKGQFLMFANFDIQQITHILDFLWKASLSPMRGFRIAQIEAMTLCDNGLDESNFPKILCHYVGLKQLTLYNNPDLHMIPDDLSVLPNVVQIATTACISPQLRHHLEENKRKPFRPDDPLKPI